MDSSITIPYWPWEHDQATYGGWNSPLWNADGGIGGGSSNAQCVSDGPFREGVFSLTPFGAQYSQTSCIRRVRQGLIPSSAEIRMILSTPGNMFRQFAEELDAVHGTVHCQIDGTMCERFLVGGQPSFPSANDPVFFLHHSNVDKLWAQWQSQSSVHAAALNENPNTLVLAGTGVLASTIMDISNMDNGNICVRYEDPMLGMASDGQNQRVTCPLPWVDATSSWFSGRMSSDEVTSNLNDRFCSSNARVPPVA